MIPLYDTGAQDRATKYEIIDVHVVQQQQHQQQSSHCDVSLLHQSAVLWPQNFKLKLMTMATSVRGTNLVKLSVA